MQACVILNQVPVTFKAVEPGETIPKLGPAFKKGSFCKFSYIELTFEIILAFGAIFMTLFIVMTSYPSQEQESNHSLHLFLDSNGLELAADNCSVRWKQSNRKHPRNWPTTRKIYDIGLVFLLDFLV